MNKILVLLIKGISLLPFGVIYFLSDLLYLLFFRTISYRRKVVMDNLRKSFPEKSEKEIRIIARRYYRFLADLILESIKLFSISEKELRTRMKLKNHEICNKYFDQGKSIIILCAHYGNFEYGAVSTSLGIKHRVNTVYLPLKNKVFDDFLQRSRRKFGTCLVSTKNIYQNLEMERRQGILSAYGMASDQAPKSYKGYWMEFLNQDTPMIMGYERIAREYDMPVVYGEVEKIKRGRYVLVFYDLFDKPGETQPGEIIETYSKILEACIRKKPELWFWSHKRWKRKIPPDLPEKNLSKKYPVRKLPKTDRQESD